MSYIAAFAEISNYMVRSGRERAYIARTSFEKSSPDQRQTECLRIFKAFWLLLQTYFVNIWHRALLARISEVSV